MALTNSTALRNAMADKVTDLLDAGSGAAKLIIEDSGDTELVEITLNDPSFGVAVAGVITLDLPAASANDGLSFKVVKTDVSGNAVTIDADGADLVNTAGTHVLGAQGDAVTIVSDGVSNWWIF